MSQDVEQNRCRREQSCRYIAVL